MAMKLFWITLFLSLASLANAEDIYVAQNAAGSDDGTSSANAKSLAWANTSANWGVGANKISAGDTVHLCGTLTNVLTVNGSGSFGSPITILFETDAKFSAPTFTNCCITVGAHNYITVDGGSNGLIEATDTGTGLSYTNSNGGVCGSDASFLTVQNLQIRNMYQRTGTTDLVSGGVGVYNSGESIAWSGLTVTNCKIGNCYQGILASYRTAGASNITFAANQITNCNWGMALGDAGAGTISHVRVFGNSVSNSAVWDEDTDQFHHNGLYFYSENGGTTTDVEIYGNTFGPGYGTWTTGGTFFSGGLGVISVYNNIFLSSGTNPANGHITFQPYYNSSSTLRAFNNTMVADAGIGIYVNFQGGSTNGTNIALDFKNNIFNSNATAIALFTVGETNNFAIDYNLYYGLNASEAFSFSSTSSGDFRNFTNWQTSFDQHGTNLNPLLEAADYSLQSSSPAIDAGADLSSYFTTDFAGNDRGGTWDIGAYEFAAEESPAPDETAPTVAVTSPSSTNRWHITLTGTASDDVGVDHVTVTLNGTSLGNATGTTNWSMTVDLREGANTVIATAFDAFPNSSPTNVTINFAPNQRVRLKGVRAAGGTLRSN